jgi:hypothetical protein
VHREVQSRSKLTSQALTGDVDWVRVVGQLASVMPTQVGLTALQVSHPVSTSNASSVAGSGSLSMEVKGTGGLPTAAAWLTDLSGDPDLSGLTIGAVTVDQNGGKVIFSSNATLTPQSYSHRDQEFGK